MKLPITVLNINNLNMPDEEVEVSDRIKKARNSNMMPIGIEYKDQIN